MFRSIALAAATAFALPVLADSHAVDLTASGDVAAGEKAFRQCTSCHVVVNDAGELQGVFTDGDLRRAVDNNVDINSTPMRMLIKSDCMAVHRDLLAAEALKIMEDHKISALVVEDSNHYPIGVLHMHDILRSGVM